MNPASGSGRGGMDGVAARAQARYGPEYPIDPGLWFVDDDHCGGRHYLTYNHTRTAAASPCTATERTSACSRPSGT